jgi:hypothetical protein
MHAALANSTQPHAVRAAQAVMMVAVLRHVTASCFGLVDASTSPT